MDTSFFLAFCVVAQLVHCGPTNLHFTDIAQNEEAGLFYRFIDGEFGPVEAVPTKDRNEFRIRGTGNGLLVWDFDNDGDLDIYATSSSGVPNHLFKNLLMEAGQLRFQNVYEEAGVGLPTEDSRGACCADIDNDGYLDFYVCSEGGSHDHLFLNNRDGTFRDITQEVGLPGLEDRLTIGCSFGDVNHDGFHDLYVGVTIKTTPCDLTSTNILYISGNAQKFEDESTLRGVDTFGGMTWALTLIDYDQDGDLDIITGDDGCRGFFFGDPLLGYVRIWENDGKGFFSDMTSVKSVNVTGGYMGQSFADYDQDGTIDVFVTDIGHWLNSFRTNFTTEDEGRNSRWFLNDATGTFRDPGLSPDIGNTPFGWGTCSFDLDNSGTSDIIFHGGFVHDGIYLLADAPGIPMINQGNATFVLDYDAVSETDHRPRKVHAVATGDINNDGFCDVVSLSVFDMGTESVITLQSEFGVDVNSESLLPFGSGYDDLVGFVPHAFEFNSTHYLYNERARRNFGSISVEINSADNGNNWVSITVAGSIGVARNARTPRDGIGAVIRVTPFGKKAQIIPVTSGDSEGSTSALTKIFGLADSGKADVEILWPGNVANKIYDVFAGEEVILHEIPCSFSSSEWQTFDNFRKCVLEAVCDLEHWDVIFDINKVYSDQIRAYLELHPEEIPTSVPSAAPTSLISTPPSPPSASSSASTTSSKTAPPTTSSAASTPQHLPPALVRTASPTTSSTTPSHPTPSESCVHIDPNESLPTPAPTKSLIAHEVPSLNTPPPTIQTTRMSLTPAPTPPIPPRDDNSPTRLRTAAPTTGSAVGSTKATVYASERVTDLLTYISTKAPTPPAPSDMTSSPVGRCEASLGIPDAPFVSNIVVSGTPACCNECHKDDLCYVWSYIMSTSLCVLKGELRGVDVIDGFEGIVYGEVQRDQIELLSENTGQGSAVKNIGKGSRYEPTIPEYMLEVPTCPIYVPFTNSPETPTPTAPSVFADDWTGEYALTEYCAYPCGGCATFISLSGRTDDGFYALYVEVTENIDEVTINETPYVIDVKSVDIAPDGILYSFRDGRGWQIIRRDEIYLDFLIFYDLWDIPELCNTTLTLLDADKCSASQGALEGELVDAFEVGSRGECCDFCYENEECIAWQFNSVKRRCNLKSAVDLVIESSVEWEYAFRVEDTTEPTEFVESSVESEEIETIIPPDTCTTSPDIPNSNAEDVCPLTHSLEVCTVTCNDGYMKSGDDPRCLEGTWGILPFCTEFVGIAREDLVLLSGGEIAGIVIGVLVVCGIIIAAVCCGVNRKYLAVVDDDDS